MTIASALDKLNDKLAGSDQPASQTIEGMILRLIDNIDQGGGGSIPIASADTLGGIKVGENLSITEGGVLSATGGGGGGDIVIATFSDEDDAIVCDYTVSQLLALLDAGTTVFGKYTISGEDLPAISLTFSAAKCVESDIEGDYEYVCFASPIFTDLNGSKRFASCFYMDDYPIQFSVDALS